MPDFSYENKFSGLIAGVDEAGRGPWAGPVVAAAIIVKDQNNFPAVDDSKKLSQAQREKWFKEIMESAYVGIGIQDVDVIDSTNILAATKLAMIEAVEKLDITPNQILVDGNQLFKTNIPILSIIKGDSISTSIAAASIIAKVTRDRIMIDLDAKYPEYDWANNKGYGTKSHQSALEAHGATPHHRKTFKPIIRLLEYA